MNKELEYFPIAVQYFRDFVSANLHEFYLHIKEYRTYPGGGYSSFYRDNEVMQVLDNIYHNIDETLGDLKIPETFPSPKALAKSWESFLVFLKNEDKLFDDVYKRLGNKKENFPYPIILTVIDNDRRKVVDLLEHILSFEEVRKYLDDNQNMEVQDSKIKFIIAPPRIFDLVIVTAILMEYEQIIKLVQNGSIPDFKDPSSTTYYQGEIKVQKGKIIKVLVVCANKMGMTSAASLVSKVIYRFTPRVIAMVGIAAGVAGNVGDIMVPDILWDYGSGKSSLKTIKIFGPITKEIEKFTPYRYPIIIKQDLIGNLERITAETDINSEIYRLGERIDFQGKSAILNSYIGPFVSGAAVIASDKILSQIKSQDGKLVGFDMEAFAVAYACSVSDITPQPIAIIVKSISDFGNKCKSHIDKNKHQEYAAFTSANFLYLLVVRHPELFDFD
jgi:nucleoside phosphorylase